MTMRDFHNRSRSKVSILLTAGFIIAAAYDIFSGHAQAQEWQLGVPMPDSLTQHVLRDMIEKGDHDLPPTLFLSSQAEMHARCPGVSTDVWGCTVDFNGLKVVYIWDGLYGPRLEQTILHEYAHAMFGYEH